MPNTRCSGFALALLAWIVWWSGSGGAAELHVRRNSNIAMWRLIIGAPLLVISLNSACSSGAVTEEEYEVYSYLIDYWFRPNPTPIRCPYIVMADHTIVPPRAKNEVRAQWSLLTRSAWLDFDEKNQKSWPLVDRFFTGTRCYLVSASKPGWYDFRAFEERFPRSCATIVFSRVGFASRGRFAVVYVNDLYAFDMSPALDRYYFLAKAGTGWRVLGDFAPR